MQRASEFEGDGTMSFVKICHARGGDPTYTPGNQTGTELAQGNWYNGGWTLLLRPKNPAVAERIAAAAEAGVANRNIGYSQSTRNTARAEAKKHGMRLDLIDAPCNVDCSSFVSLCAECAGAIGEAQYSGGNAPWTGNMREKFTGSGAFEALADSKYLTGPDWLKRGDILVNEPAATGHTVIITSDGDKAAPAAMATHGNGVEVNGEAEEPLEEPLKPSPLAGRVARRAGRSASIPATASRSMGSALTRGTPRGWSACRITRPMSLRGAIRCGISRRSTARR